MRRAGGNRGAGSGQRATCSRRLASWASAPGRLSNVAMAAANRRRASRVSPGGRASASSACGAT
eukprot:11172175-Lingulodinium_polyedra.AAC.1